MMPLWWAFAFQLATLLLNNFLRSVRHSKLVIKVWFIILLLAYMTEFASRLNVLKAKYKSYIQPNQVTPEQRENPLPWGHAGGCGYDPRVLCW